MNIKRKLNKAIEWSNQELATPTAFAYLPEIIELLESLKTSEDSDMNRKYAGALGRLITEDYNFSESQLGGFLGDVADYFLPHID